MGFYISTHPFTTTTLVFSLTAGDVREVIRTGGGDSSPDLPDLARGRPVGALLPCPSLWGACPPISISGRVPISTLQTGS